MTSVVHYVSLLLPDFIIILISCIAEHESRLYTVHALLICMYEKKKKKKIKELTLKSFIHNLFFYMMNTSYLQTFSFIFLSLFLAVIITTRVVSSFFIAERGGQPRNLGLLEFAHPEL